MFHWLKDHGTGYMVHRWSFTHPCNHGSTASCPSRFAPGKEHTYSTDTWLGMHHSRSGCCIREERQFPCWTSIADRSVRSLATLLCFWRDSPPVGQGLLIHEVSRSHTTTHHSLFNSSGRVISSSQRPLPWQHTTLTTDIHASGGGFDPTISASKRPQTYALDRAANVTGLATILTDIYFSLQSGENPIQRLNCLATVNISNASEFFYQIMHYLLDI